MQGPAYVTFHVVLMLDASSGSPHVTNINNSSTRLLILNRIRRLLYAFIIPSFFNKVHVDCNTRELTETNKLLTICIFFGVKRHTYLSRQSFAFVDVTHKHRKYAL